MIIRVLFGGKCLATFQKIPKEMPKLTVSFSDWAPGLAKKLSDKLKKKMQLND
jgi:hypothetical protein